jgi:hypothetical protein
MSDAKTGNQDLTASGDAGRMLSRARRQAMSRGGKNGVAKSPQVSPQVPRVKPATRSPEPRPDAARVESAAPVNQADASAVDCGCTHTNEAQTLEAVCNLIETEGSGTPSVRQLCRERRRALSSQGKPAKGQRTNNGTNRRQGGTSSNGRNNLSGRAAAQARREELCLIGRGDSPACRPSGRVRGSAETPVKVEEGNTLRGNLITGTQVERSSKVTGIESGSCRAITGTEYIGAEQYGELCATTPAPAAAKVGLGSTSRGQRVSGTEVGRSVQVTGDEHGACKHVTGNEYISSEQFESFCASKPASSPAKVGVSATFAGQRISGSEVGRSNKVTGDEPGSCLKLTGSQYVLPDASGNMCQGSGVPHKVSVMSTLRERAVTGTDVSASAAVTGSEYGACENVTGTEYAGLQQYQACNRTPVLTPEKVSVMRTWHDQAVSGTSIERNSKVTGDEYGGCQPISGTEYIGPGQYAGFCASDRLAASRERVATAHGAAGASMTGVRTGGQGTEHKVTGGARGNAQYLSGTPYSDDATSLLSGAVGMSQHHLTRLQSDQNRASMATATAPVQRNFSVLSPARTAQESQLNRVTGTAYGAQGRITGPVNLAAGLVSGTPEFRYKDDSAVTVETIASVAPTNRVTGEGREGGFAISGAAWQRGGSITGTEGSSATRRNPTQRGDQRSMAMQTAAMKKERENTPVPPSKITGSSGNAASGSTITYSGGARG